MRFIFLVLFFLTFYSFTCSAQSYAAKNTTLNRSPFVGAELGTLTNPVRVAYKMKVEEGIIIYKVFPNSAADKASLQEKDVIIAVGSTYLSNLKEFQDFIKTKNGNDTLSIFFVRNDTIRNTSLILSFLPRESNFYFETMYDQIELDSQTSLRTILTFPRSIESDDKQITQFPLVIVLNSASNESIERGLYSTNKSSKGSYQFYDWIEQLTKNGFATLRIEKKGVGDSDGKINQWTYQDEQKSIYSVLEKIKKYGSINKQKIYLVALGSSSLVALEYFIQYHSDSITHQNKTSKIAFTGICIEKLPADLQKTKNQNVDSLKLIFPHLSFFSPNYPKNAISNLLQYNTAIKNNTFFWIESKDDIIRVLRALKKDVERE